MIIKMTSPDRSGLSIAVAGVVGAVAGAVATGIFNYLNHAADIDAKMIELSVGILRAEATPETRPLREWAIDVIGKRAAFNFDEAQKAVLLKQELPFKGPSFVPTTSNYSGFTTGGVQAPSQNYTGQPGAVLGPAHPSVAPAPPSGPKP